MAVFSIPVTDPGILAMCCIPAVHPVKFLLRTEISCGLNSASLD